MRNAGKSPRISAARSPLAVGSALWGICGISYPLLLPPKSFAPKESPKIVTTISPCPGHTPSIGPLHHTSCTQLIHRLNGCTQVNQMWITCAQPSLHSRLSPVPPLPELPPRRLDGPRGHGRGCARAGTSDRGGARARQRPRQRNARARGAPRSDTETDIWHTNAYNTY